MNHFENPKNKTESQELKPAKIELHFFRHSIKETNDVTLPNDEAVKLSKAGKYLAIKKSFGNVNLDQAIAFGSPRVRTQESALLMMVGKKDTITGSESLDELKEIINQDLKIGSKIGIDERLNFTDSNDTAVGKAMNDAYALGKYVQFMVDQSDKLAKETHDESGANYSAKAAQVAKIIIKYVGIIPKWQKLVSDESKGYTDTMERYMGTHASVSEAFLAKAIEITEGVDARDKFVAEYPNGFDYLEGFEADIIQEPNKNPVVEIRFYLDNKMIRKTLSVEEVQNIAI